MPKQNLQLLFRFAFEEEFRRNISKANKEAITDDQVIDLLFQDHKQYFDGIIDVKKTEITTEIMSQLMSGVDQAMAPFTQMATHFMQVESGAAQPLEKNEELKQGEVPMQVQTTSPTTKTVVQEEEKKGEDLNAIKSLNMDTLMQMVDAQAKTAPW